MLKEFKVVLDQPWQGEFFSGSQVSGTFHVEVDSPMKCSFIQAKLYGYARTCLDRAKSDVELVNSQVIVHEGRLQPGQRNFPFQFTLPEQIPSTFLSVNGKGLIKYFVEGCIFPRRPGTPQGPGTPLVITEQIPITETLTVLHPRLQTPVTQQAQRQICCWHSPNPGNLVLTVNSSRTSYCAGEQIPLTIKVQNDTEFQVMVKAVLLRTITYSAQRKCQQSSYMIMKHHRRNPVQPKSTITWTPLGMQTDSSEPVTSTSANIITVKHCAEVTAEVVIPLTVNKLVKIETPLTIGNVLYQDTNEVVSHTSPPIPPLLDPAFIPDHTSTHIPEQILEILEAPPTDAPPTYDAVVQNSTGVPSCTSTELTSLPPPAYEVALTMRSIRCT